MSGAIATAYVKLIPTFDKNLKTSIAGELGGVDGKSAGSKVGKLFSKGVESGTNGLKNALTSRFSAMSVAVGNIAARAVTGAFSAIGNSIDSAIKRVDTINNFPRIMEGMGIAAEASQASIKRLSEGIDGLPTALDDAVSGVQRFTAKNGDIERSTDYFLAVNNAIASGGASMEIQSSALEQLSQSYSKGKMDMMEWRSLQQAMPAQLNQIAKAMGTTADELGEGLRNGNISMDEFMDKIVELNEEGVDGLDSFAGQARKATAGIGTAMTNVQNRINKAVAGIIDAIGQENISGAINAFSAQFGKIGSIIGGTDSEGNVVGFVAGLKSGLEHAFDGWEPKFNIDWGELFENATEAAEKLGELLSGPLSELLKLSDSALATTSSALSSIGGKLSSVFGPFVEKIAPGLESISDGFSKFLAPIVDFIEGHGPAFDGMMERIYGHIDDMAPTLDSLAGHFNDLCTRLEPIGGPLGEAAAEVIGNLLSAIVGLGTLAVDILDAIVGSLDALLKAADDFANGAGDAFNWLVENMGAIPPGCEYAVWGLDNVTAAANKIPSDKTVTVEVNDQASSILNGIASKMASIGKGVIANVYSRVVGQAAGGFLSLHASGGFVTNGPTYLGRDRLGYGHIAGEAGREWIKKHADGTTSIIPIENRRYLKPYAQEIAGMIGGGASTVYNISISDFAINDDAEIRNATRDYLGVLMRKGAMNVG